MKLLSLFFYHLGNIISHSTFNWTWGGLLYQKLMFLSIDFDTNFEVWEKPKRRKAKKK
jgi:hypothetical protein